MKYYITKLGLIGRIAAIIIVVEIVAFSTIGWFYTDRFSSAIESQTYRHMQLFNRMIANEELPVSTIARKSFVGGLLGNDYIEGFAAGGNKLVIVSSNSKYLGKKLEAIEGFDAQWFSPQAPGEQFIIKEDKLISIAYLKSDSGQMPLYYTATIISTAKLNAMKNRIILFGTLGSLFFILLSSAVIIFIAQRFVAKRIKSSLDVLKQAETNNLNPRIEITINDEIGQLQRGINSTLDAVVSFREKLNQVNENLENRVKDAVKEIRAKDEILIQQSKHAALGEMLGNIAHQWRQPLNSLGLKIQSLEDDFYYDRIDQKYIEKTSKEAMETIQYMSKTIDDFRNFFAPQKYKDDFHVIEIVEEIHHILDERLKDHNILLNITGEDIIIFGFSNEFKQAVLNIINNATDAILEQQEYGKIDDGYINISIQKENEAAVIKIADNGGGISESIIDKVFDPYFTTKFQTQGTGVGLYMSKTIIEKNMEGKIDVATTENGSIFTITLPLKTSEI